MFFNARNSVSEKLFEMMMGNFHSVLSIIRAMK